MNDEWLETVIGLIAQIVNIVYSKEESNYQNTSVNSMDIEEKNCN